MKRRTFIGTLTGGLLATPLVAEAQSPGKVPRIGVLVPAEPKSPNEPNIAAFRRGLQDLGYVEGQNIASSTGGLTAKPNAILRLLPNWSALT